MALATKQHLDKHPRVFAAKDTRGIPALVLRDSLKMSREELQRQATERRHLQLHAKWLKDTF